MKPGEAVEVYTVWAAQSPRAALKHWFKGYRFVRVEGVTSIVQHTEGVFEGCDVRYPSQDVRSASPGTTEW